MFRNHAQNLASAAALALLACAVPATAQQCTCVGDQNHDGLIDGADLGMLLGDWGTSAIGSDLNGSGLVDGADLGTLLGLWGMCGTPTNDNCANAVWIEEGETPFCTLYATSDGPSFPAGCQSGITNFDQDIWFRYEATKDGVLTVSTCDAADFDSVIAVYGSPNGIQVCPGPNGANLVGCNDDSPLTCGNMTSSVDVNVVEGHIYLIRVGGYFIAPSGTGTLQRSWGDWGSTPELAHDLDPYEQTQSISGYTGDMQMVNDFPQACSSGFPSGPREWIRWASSCGGTVTVTTCNDGTDYDTVLVVVKDEWGTPETTWETFIACNDDTTAPGCGLPNGLNHKSRVQFQCQPWTYYYFIVSGYNGASGDYELTVTRDCN